jgi:hypothetical protein
MRSKKSIYVIKKFRGCIADRRSSSNKKQKIFESILSQRIINLNDLRSASWKGIPMGN